MEEGGNAEPPRPLTETLLVGGSGKEAETRGSATAVLLFSTLIAVCGSYVFGAALGYSSPAESGIMEDLGLSLAEYSVFGSIMAIGAMVGALMSGKIADMVGRRAAMGISDVLYLVGSFAIMFSQGPWSLYFGRLIVGCGVGLISYVVPVYISEITPKNLRGSFATFHSFMVSFGVAVTYFVGNVVSWRLLALIGAVPSMVQLFGLFFVPESPRWLAKVARDIECEIALRYLRGKTSDISEEATEINEYTLTLCKISEGRISDLFQKIYARSLIVGVGLMALQQLGGSNTISFYASSIFKSAGFPAGIGTVTMALVQIPMALLGVLLMDGSGRRPLLVVSASGTCFGSFLAGLSFFMEDHLMLTQAAPSLVFTGMVVYKASFVLGFNGIPWLIMSEIFPINMKGPAGSLVSLVHWFTLWIVSYIFNYLMELNSACCLSLSLSLSLCAVLSVQRSLAKHFVSFLFFFPQEPFSYFQPYGC